MVSTVAAFVFALGILIVVHEYGHYLIARWCGVKVLRFSVGFGKALITRSTRAGQYRMDAGCVSARWLREDAR